MKRNQPSPDTFEETIDSRLKDIFGVTEGNNRVVIVTSKGHWLPDKKHVKIESRKGISSELINYSPELRYNFLQPLEALYCLESSKLIIFHDEIPLSLVEAYHVLLTSKDDFARYRVFQQLNRMGYICLTSRENDRVTTSHELHSQLPVEQISVDQYVDNSKPLTKIDASSRLSKDVLSKLQECGPKSWDCSEACDSEFSFDLYKRETFSKKRLGNPDYRVIISEEHKNASITRKHLDIIHSDRYNSEKILFCLLAEDMSMCFAQFKAIGPDDLLQK